MNEALQSYLTWWQFLIIAAILWFIYYLLRRFKTYIFHATSLKTLHLPVIILLGLFLIAFVMLNPVIDGFVIIVALVLFYPVISSFLQGIIAFTNTNLSKGDLIKVGKKQGRISDISLSGVKLLTGSNNIFIPFSQLAENVIERYQSDQTLYLSFYCKPIDEETKLSLATIEKLIFNFPFLDNKSNIEISQLNNKIKVNLSLANNRFRASLLKQITEAGYSIELSKNN